MKKHDPLWQYRELDRVLAQMRPAFDLQKLFPSSYFDGLHAFEVLSRKFSFPVEYLNLSNQLLGAINIADLQSSMMAFDRINKDYFGAFEALHHNMESTFAALVGATSAIDVVSNSLSESLASAEALARSYSLADAGVEALLRYHEPFEKFARSYLVDASSGASAVFQKNSASLISEAARLLPDLSYVSEMSALLGPGLLEGLLDLPRANVFEELRVDLDYLNLEDDKVDVVVAVGESASGQVVEIGGRLVRRVYDLNIESERLGEKPVFAPTTKSMMAFHQVPSTVVSDEGSFLEVVDSLYFLLYEGSGDAARLTSKFEQERLEALWLLKQLRLGARHDLDHGKPKDVERKKRAVGAAYEKLIGMPTPKMKSDWQRVQKSLYDCLATMLDDLWFG
jgi:hypothetical protein